MRSHEKDGNVRNVMTRHENGENAPYLKMEHARSEKLPVSGRHRVRLILTGGCPNPQNSNHRDDFLRRWNPIDGCLTSSRREISVLPWEAYWLRAVSRAEVLDTVGEVRCWISGDETNEDEYERERGEKVREKGMRDVRNDTSARMCEKTEPWKCLE